MWLVLLSCLFLPEQTPSKPVISEVEISLPSEVSGRAGRFVRISAKTSGKQVKWICDGSKDSEIAASRDDGKDALFVAPSPGKYRVWAYTALADKPTDPASTWVTVTGVGPTPDPGPSPDPKPDPFPPTPLTKLYIAVIEETATPRVDRGAFLTDSDLLNYIKNKDFTYRWVDKDVVGPDGRPPNSLLPYLNAARGKALPYVVIVGPNGGIPLFEGPLPATPTDLLITLKKVGG